ncbi:MAG: SDR family NAD(P)-dependent oxidoreductase [Gammaproteobacteria bacterium]
MTEFSGKNVVITGAADGIGKALALNLIRQGANVVVTDIDERKLANFLHENRGSSSHVACQLLDVTDETAVEQLLDDVKKEMGQIDYVFNNAGIAVTGDCRDISMDQWRKVTAVNQWGVIYGAMAAYKIMAEQGSGHIINTASLAGLIPFPTNLPYSATKSAVVGLSMSLRAEAQDLGVKVSVVCPGFIRSNIFEASEMVNVPRDEIVSNIAFKLVEADVAADKILNGVRKNKAVIIFPTYAKIFWWMYRLSPVMIKPLALRLIRDLRKVRN